MSTPPGRGTFTPQRPALIALPAEVERLQAVYELAVAVSRAAALTEVYDSALSALHAALGADRSSILFFDPDGVMRFKAWRGLSEGYRRAVEGHSPWAPDTSGAKPVLVPDVEQ